MHKSQPVARYYLHCPIQINLIQTDTKSDSLYKEFGTDTIDDCLASVTFRIVDGAAIVNMR